MGGRIPSGVGINFAQRVDLLRELLEGRAETEQVERLGDWTTWIEDLYPSAWRIGRSQAIARHLQSRSDTHQVLTDDAEYLAWTLVSTLLVDADVEPPADDDRPALEVLQGGRHVLLASPRLRQQTVVTATFTPESGAPSVHVERDGAVGFEASGPGVLRVAVNALEQPVPVELLLHLGQPRPLTPAIVRERTLADWVNELEQRPFLRVSPEATVVLEDARRLGSTDGATATWRRPLQCADAGLYLVLGVARENEGVSLSVTGLAATGGSHLPTVVRGRRRIQVLQAWGTEGLEATINAERAQGVTGDVTVELTVWVAKTLE